MNILLCSYWFAPNFGGVETVSKILAEEWTSRGHTVTVVTETAASDVPDEAQSRCGYIVVRKPGRAELQRLGRASDVIFQNLISLQTLLPLLLTGKPAVVAHQSWMRTTDGGRGWQNVLKMLAVRFVINCSISQAIADDIPVRSTIIPNPFEALEFLPFHDDPKIEDIVFVGRLVSDKGVNLLLDAVGELRKRSLTPTVSIIGGGPELLALQDQAKTLGIDGQVSFLGPMHEGRGRVLARHRIHVVPSRWKEPFGVVALEGIASGCAMIVSEGGGLPYAMGPCGLTFPNNDTTALAAQLERLLTDSGLRDTLTAPGLAHLEHFRPERVAAQYLCIFEQVLMKRNRQGA
jgi:glycogen(starch) synthase